MFAKNVSVQKLSETLGWIEFYRFIGTYYLSIRQLQPLMFIPAKKFFHFD